MAADDSGQKDLWGDPWRPPRDPRGRKAHRASPQVREIVANLVSTGSTAEEIALQLGLSLPTLRKYYFRELDHGHSLARQEVLKRLYAKAMEGSVAAMREYLRQTDRVDALQVAYRPPAPEKIGKKAEAQAAAEQVGGGIFQPGAPPATLTPH